MVGRKYHYRVAQRGDVVARALLTEFVLRDIQVREQLPIAVDVEHTRDKCIQPLGFGLQRDILGEVIQAATV